MINERHFSAYKNQLTSIYGLVSGKRFLDLTLGDGGHTQEALEAGCQVVSFDLDPESIQRSERYLSGIKTPIIIEDFQSYSQDLDTNADWIIIKSNFVDAKEAITKLKLDKFDYIMVDLGPSQNQVLSEERGFSFNPDSILDMRIDPTLAVTAKDLLNGLNEGELRDIFELGDEPFARPIARIVAEKRKATPIETCKQLSDLVSFIKRKVRSDTHPATQVFMSLRMAVNLERENIKLLIPTLPELLKKDGIFGIISFHSVEDRLVKDEINKLVDQNIVSLINKKPLGPSKEELKISQRTRSAKLRLAKKHN